MLLEEVALSLVTELCDPVTHSESNSTFCAPSQKLSEHGILKGMESQPSNMSLTRTKPVTTSVSTFQPYLHVPPLEGHIVLKEFLQKSSQLEVLKEEWSSEFLPNGAPCTPKQYKIFQSVKLTGNLLTLLPFPPHRDMYLNKVLLPAKRVVAKKRATRITKVHIDNVSISPQHSSHIKSYYITILG